MLATGIAFLKKEVILMSGPPRINDTVHNQLDMEWSNSLGEKKKPWKTMLSFVIILAVILLAILVPGFLLGS